jgi:hypothetical protein
VNTFAAFAIASPTGTRKAQRCEEHNDEPASRGREHFVDLERSEQIYLVTCDRALLSGTRSLIEQTLGAKRAKVSNQGTETVSFESLSGSSQKNNRASGCFSYSELAVWDDVRTFLSY